MFTTYNEALDWIHSRLKLGIKPGLKRMEWMMERLGNPESKIKSVHIGGTNGKGSTVTFLRSIFQAAGYTVGTFTSPYIEQFNERISVNGIPISDGEILKLANIILPLAEELEDTELGGPTEFEIITAMSFYYFGEVHPADIVLYEVGLGGRLDSTNIILPLVSIITNIGLDHTQILGNSYEEIAFEKAGIIKQETPLFTAARHPGARKVIEGQAEKKQAPIYRLDQEFTISAHRTARHGEIFSLTTDSIRLDDLETRMIGRHQTENAALAVMAAMYLDQLEAYTVTEQDIREGLLRAFWPGRFEIVSEKPLIILDGAHNDEGITALVNELSARFADRFIHIIFTALKDKKLDQMILRLDQIANKLTFVTFDYPRASKAHDLFAISRSENKLAVEDNWEEYVKEAAKTTEPGSVLVITGSLYFISQVKNRLFKFSKNNSISL